VHDFLSVPRASANLATTLGIRDDAGHFDFPGITAGSPDAAWAAMHGGMSIKGPEHDTQRRAAEVRDSLSEHLMNVSSRDYEVPTLPP